MIVALTAIWTERNQVLAAYSHANPNGVELHFTGIDLDVQPIAIPPSPYQIESAPDTTNSVIKVNTADHGVWPHPEVLLFGGKSSIEGTVIGPDGPVEGATVNIERHTVDGTASTEVTTNADGSWESTELIGGRYRIRAWKPFELTMNSSEVLFVVDAESVNLDLAVAPIDPALKLRFASPGEVVVGFTATVAVSVTTSSVDHDGFELVTGVGEQTVTLTPGPGIMVSPTSAVTDADGVATFGVWCVSEGNFGAEISHETGVEPVSLADCVAEPPPGEDDALIGEATPAQGGDSQ